MYFTVSKGGFTLLCAICCSQPLLRLLRAHFFFLFSFFAPISVQQSVTASRRASKPGSQLSFQPAGLPALSSLSGQQTVEERASLSKLMARALLPGLKMNWNVVYLKHTRPPPGRKITQHKNSGPSLRVIFYPGGETCCGKTISLITLPLSFDLPLFCCLVFVLFCFILGRDKTKTEPCQPGNGFKSEDGLHRSVIKLSYCEKDQPC